MSSEAKITKSHADAGLQIPWGALTIGLTVITIASLGALVTVVSIKDIDTLSVVALALAVLAFAAQLIISLAQASAGAQQVAQTERVNADTQSALSEIRATSNSLLANQKEVFGHVLRAALPEVARELSGESAAADGESTSLDQAEIELRLTNAIDKALSTVSSRQTSSPTSIIEAIRSAPSKPHPIYSTLTTFPNEKEGRRYFRILESLSPWTSQRFGEIIGNVKQRAIGGHSPTFVVRVNPGEKLSRTLQELLDKGLIAEMSKRHDKTRGEYTAYNYTLTDDGIGVAQLMASRNVTPDWLTKMFLGSSE